jgi:quercetin dioxygenase-like cupin family protein
MYSEKRKTLTMLAVAVALLCPLAAVAASQHVISPPSEAHWGPAPPLLPAGAQIAVLPGDPTAAGPSTVRLRFPGNYRIPAHSHPVDEYVIVTSGTLYIGMGDTLDTKVGKELTTGGFALLPAGMNHFAYTKTGATVVLSGVGPVGFKYVNPGDDPRNAMKK